MLGIGLNSPDSKLHVEKLIPTVINGTNLANSSSVALSITVPDIPVDAGSGIAIALGMNGRGRTYISTIWNSPNKDQPDLAFFTTGAGNVTTERIRVKSAGNVGIGTDTPSYKLNVNPASDSNNGIQILNNSAGT